MAPTIFFVLSGNEIEMAELKSSKIENSWDLDTLIVAHENVYAIRRDIFRIFVWHPGSSVWFWLYTDRGMLW